jgi:hypothetical protein
MIEIIDCLTAAGGPIKDEDRVIHLFASSPNSPFLV